MPFLGERIEMRDEQGSFTATRRIDGVILLESRSGREIAMSPGTARELAEQLTAWAAKGSAKLWPGGTVGSGVPAFNRANVRHVEAQSCGVRCPECGEYETACRC